ncbi:MAG: molecular chaperone DnaK [Acidobacteriota bacterium]|jgi:molecular chaperone DnaK|nr:molecular chaperone DnaK [Acidobacteriota bacterium]
MARNLGIDLGTTNSCISYLDGGKTSVIPTNEGSRVIPTVVAVNREKQHVFGNVARRQIQSNSRDTIWGIKRLMGRKFQSPEVQSFRRQVAYEIVEAPNGDAHVNFSGRVRSPEEISGLFLDYLHHLAREFLNEEIGDTVITVPAFFNDAQRQSTKTAGRLAGLNVSRIINEPTAALIAYSEQLNRDGLYAVYDLGGGTFDVSIVEVKEEVFKVLSTIGDTFLGGSDFDAQVIDWVVKTASAELGQSLSPDDQTHQRIVQAAEKAKIELSHHEEAQVTIPYLVHRSGNEAYHFQHRLTRTELEHLTGNLVERTIGLVQRSLDEINLEPAALEGVILVGGQSRMPLVSRRLTELFGKPPESRLNPEEVVARGAVLQAEILRGRVKDLLLLDVTPLSLGVEAKGDKFERIIDRNSTIPLKRSRVFTTINDNQQVVKINVLQGERELASQNRSLGEFSLVGIPLAPKGIPQIEVSFEIDANGIVKVSAKDKQTGISQSMKVQPASGLAPEEIERIVEESARFREQDNQRLQLAQLREDLQRETETVRFYLEHHTDKIDLAGQSEIRSLVGKVAKALEGEDIALMSRLLERVQKQRNRINSQLMAEFES